MKTKRFSLEISDDAQVDFDKSYDFYFEESPKVADRFFRRISISIENIKQNPNSYPVAHKEVRKNVVKNFPYVIYFKILDLKIQVIAIFHTSRNPEIWNERI